MHVYSDAFRRTILGLANIPRTSYSGFRVDGTVPKGGLYGFPNIKCWGYSVIYPRRTPSHKLHVLVPLQGPGFDPKLVCGKDPKDNPLDSCGAFLDNIYAVAMIL